MADTPKPWRTPLLRDAKAGVHADAGQHSNRTYQKLTLARPLIRPLGARRAALMPASLIDWMPACADKDVHRCNESEREGEIIYV